MTREEAIKILDSIWVKGIWRKTNEIDWNEAGDALNMAADALKAQDRPTDGDLISRQAAIDALYDKGSSMTAWGELLAMKWSDIQKCIEQLPSADRPRGEWIFRRELVEDTPFTGYRCSNCNYWQGMGSWNFCPNCGADMRGEDK